MKRKDAIQPIADKYVEILFPLDKIPPQEWLDKCKTNPQKDHFYRIEVEFTLIRIHLFRFFSGVSEFHIDSAVLEIENSIKKSEKFNKKFTEIIEARAAVYRAYYGVIFDGWKYLQPILKLALKDQAPKTPGETIVAIISDDCRREFMPCKMDYYEVENRKMYETILRYQALLKNYNEGQSLDQKKINLDKALRRVKSKSKALDNITKLNQICQEFITVGHSLGRKDTVLNGSIREYWNRVNDYIDIGNRRAPGHVWVKGIIQPMSSRGGVGKVKST